MNVNELARKARRVLKEEGAGMLIRKTRLYIKNVATGQKVYSEAEKAQKCCMDVLFINGCYLDHPSRYRVSGSNYVLGICLQQRCSIQIYL